MNASDPSRAAGAAEHSRQHGLLWAAVVVPCAVLLVTGVRLMAREQELRAKEESVARTDFAADASRAIVEQLRGIVLAEAVALQSPEYVESATALAGRLSPRGLALPWNRGVRESAQVEGGSILRRRALSPAACRAAVWTALPARRGEILARCDELDQAVRLAADTGALAAVRGAFGEPRIIAWNHGRWLAAMSYVDAADPVLVAVRVPDLVRAAGAGLGDSIRVVATPQPGAVPLSAGLGGLWLSWTGPPIARGFWSGRQVYLAATLAVVLGAAALAAFLLSRDVRREMRLASVRQQFVASVSHELRTPLTAIRMYAETLRDRRLDESTQEEYLNTIIGESVRLSRLVDDVLDFS
ncbi:MAG: histidine kinase dimerization/phospho-acceptor domain-containing protein, partial [Gemmatimonadota bacterium]|nr:histidine kinase dimerization/phospho-acceptor domain-containing protein [Gemmatimonadota bacterium]